VNSMDTHPAPAGARLRYCSVGHLVGNTRIAPVFEGKSEEPIDGTGSDGTIGLVACAVAVTSLTE
jgi:hypothetical protein